MAARDADFFGLLFRSCEGETREPKRRRGQTLGAMHTMARVVHRPFCIGYAKVCTITGPAIAVAGPASRGVRLCSIHASTRLFDSSAPA